MLFYILKKMDIQMLQLPKHSDIIMLQTGTILKVTKLKVGSKKCKGFGSKMKI